MSYYSPFQSGLGCPCICVLYCSALKSGSVCGVVVIELNYYSAFQSVRIVEYF
jgi:hypothetical protein